MSYRLVTPPSLEPVTLDEVKAYARIDDTAEDALLSGLISVARQWCEGFTRRAFISQGWVKSVSRLPKTDRIVLPRAPLVSVESVTVYDDADNGEVWDSANYFVDTQNEPGGIVLRSGACWPVPGRSAQGVSIVYTVGYGTSAEAVPAALRLAVKQLALHFYEHRSEAVVGESVARIPLGIEALLTPYRLLTVGAA
ncbi:MAG: head-tail connector protein [Bdellovibrionales bacterium]